MNDRKKAILEATITRYIETVEPVGSKVLTEEIPFRVSSATVRNELHSLERDGYLTHLYQSSGRIPTDKGYRYYVDSILSAPESQRSKKTMTSLSVLGNSIADVMKNVSSMMSSVVNYTTIIMTPEIYRESLKLLHFVLIDIQKVLIVLLSSVGLNKQFLVEIKEAVTQQDLDEISKFLTEKLKGKAVSDLSEDDFKMFLTEVPYLSQAVKALFKELKKVMQSQKQDTKLLVDGYSKMLLLPEFKDVTLTQKVLSAIEENNRLVTVFSEYLRSMNCKVLIGEENSIDAFKECSLVISPYQIDSESIGAVGVVGPKRMRYKKVIPMLKTISSMVSQHLSLSSMEQSILKENDHG